MSKNSPDEVWFQRYFEFHCDDCGSQVGFRSRRRTFIELYILPLFLLRPVRCAECFRRDYRLIFIPVRNRLSDTVGEPAVSATGSRTTRNVA